MVHHRRSTLLLIALALVGSGAVRCGDNEEPVCLSDAELERVPDGPLPEWAVGGFSRHAIDVYNLRVEASGAFEYVLQGGDFGGKSTGTATVAGGRVLLRAEGSSRVAALARDGEGRIYFHDFVEEARIGMGRAGRCAWTEWRPGHLCGRMVGGCGGFGEAVSCTWEEARGH